MTASTGGGSNGLQSMESVCRELKGRLDKFLATQTQDETLRSVQKQIAIGKDVVEEIGNFGFVGRSGFINQESTGFRADDHE